MQQLFGYGDPKLTFEQNLKISRDMFDVFSSTDSRFQKFTLDTSKIRRMMGWWFTRKVLGKDTENYPQLIGDCTSFGMKNVNEYLSCAEIIRGDLEEFKPIFPSYIYGAGRKIMGARSKGDGCYGSAVAKAVMTYGTINSDAPGVPKYSGQVAYDWSGPNRDGWLFEKFENVGKQHLIRTTAKITTWDELVIGLCNGYFATIASNQGFEMQARSDGFHYPRGSWPHQMSIIGVDDTYRIPYAIILNSWGNVHGQLKDFETGEYLPIGVLRVRADVVVRMMQDECFLCSQFDGFPKFEIPEDLFNPFGDATPFNPFA